MGAQIQVRLTEDAKFALERMTDAAGMMKAAGRAMDLQNQLTVSHIQQEYLSFPKSGPTVANGLRVQSNRLRGSIRAVKAVVSGSGADVGLVSAIGSNVKYAAIHEFGGTTRPHLITAKNGKALRFMGAGGVVFRRSVRHPGSTLPARGYVQAGINDRADDLAEAMGRAMIGFIGGAA